jgi:16S rRNA (guanine527-N7)-methyltransferase
VREATDIADIGAGAGFPGLPLAIALPRAGVDLIESAGRKTAVIERLAAAAGLSNARAVHARAEDWASGKGRDAYDVVTARAVAPLAILLEYAAPLLRSGGTFVAWKGAVDSAEQRAAGAAASELGLEATQIVPVTPFEGARELHLHLYSKVRVTPDRFPRRAGMAAKRPLGAKNRADPPLT